jgi:hypothetical protein
VAVKLNHEQQLTQDYTMETKSLWNVGASSVCVVHTTAEGLVLAALADGRVMVFNMANKTRFFFEPDKTCSKLTGRHSEITAMDSLSNPLLLLIGFACGKVHIYSLKDSVQDSLMSYEDHHCSLLPCIPPSLHSLVSLFTPGSARGSGVLSVWCGTSSSSVVVLDYPLSPSTLWRLSHDLDRACSIVPVTTVSSSREFTAKELRFSADGTCVLALLHQPSSQTSSLALMDTSNKTLLHFVTCSNISVSSLALTPTTLVLGTYEGLVHLFSWPEFLSSPPPLLKAQHAQTLLAHHKRVYSVSCVTGGGITTDGLTTFSPTFVGRGPARVSREFLVTVGYGKHPVILATSSLFRSLTLSAGVCLNVWML